MGTILVTVDALRADHLMQYGYKTDTVPVLRRFVMEGLSFLKPSQMYHIHGSQCHQFIHQIILATATLTNYQQLPQYFLKKISRLHALVLQLGFGILWGDLHFDDYVDLGTDKNNPESYRLIFSKVLRNRIREIPRVFSFVKKVYDKFELEPQFRFKSYTRAKEVNDEAIDWIQENLDEEFFLWLHYVEGHRPYGIHENDPFYTNKTSISEKKLMKKAGIEPENIIRSERQLMIDLYDSDLRYFADHFLRSITFLERKSIFSETNIIFTSDHGEEFNEDGEYFHRNLPYDELIHVPLITNTGGRSTDKINNQRELLDIGPAILDLHDAESPESFIGQHLFTEGNRTVISIGPQLDDNQVVACRKSDSKYIWTTNSEYLFEHSVDPAEQNNIIEESPSIRDELRREIPVELFDAVPEELRNPEDEIERAHLEALGYLELSNDKLKQDE